MSWSRTFAILTAAGLAVGCSRSSKGLTVRANAAADQPAATSLTLNGGTIVVDRVRMVVRKVEVEGSPTDGCTTPTPPTTPTTPTTPAGGTTAPVTVQDDHGGTSGDGDHQGGEAEGDHDGECELEFGPFAIDLSGAALASGIHKQFDVPVPAGTYEEIAFKIDTINAEKAGTDQVLKDLAALHASIAIDGTIDGTAFHFTTPIEVESKHEGAITVDPATGAGLTLDVDPTHWFTAADGTTRLDPNATTDQGAILANIRASLRLQHDDDGDGCDDDNATCGDHHGGADSSGHGGHG